MRQGQQNRRGRGRNRKHQNPLARSFESNGPDVKVRGTPAHIAEKYMALARDAQASGDPVLAENYLQHAEHYNRIIMAYREQFQQPGDGQQGSGFRHRQGGFEGAEGEEFGEDGDSEEFAEDAGSGPQPSLAGGGEPRMAPNHDQQRGGHGERSMERPQHDRGGFGGGRHDRGGFDNGQHGDDRGDRGDRQFRRDRDQGRFRDRNRHRGDQRNGERFYDNGPGRGEQRGDRFEGRHDRGERRHDRPERHERSERDEAERVVEQPAVAEVAAPVVSAPAPEAPAERPSRRSGGGERFQEHNQPGFLRPPRQGGRRSRAEASEAPAGNADEPPKASD